MPVLKADTTTTKIFLPSTENEPNEADRAWVTVKNKLILKDMSGLMTEKSEIEQAISGVAAYITDWNFTDENGGKLPITPDNVGLLDMQDFTLIMTKMAAVMDKAKAGLNIEEKKSSIDTSTPSMKDASQVTTPA